MTQQQDIVKRCRVTFWLLAGISVSLAIVASSASSSGFRTCKPVKTNYGIVGVATVSQRNTSCLFARDFVRRNPNGGLCDSRATTVKGWRKTTSAVGEAITVTLRKGTKAIRTNACSS